MKMIRPAIVLILLAFAVMICGCTSPMQKVLARTPHWERAAQGIAIEREFGARDLVWKPFPDMNNPVHQKIWKALWQKGRFGNGYGAICDYYGSYLVVESESFDHGRLPSFYYPCDGAVLPATPVSAWNLLYRGNRDATIDNVRRVVAYLLAARDYKAFEVDDSNQIPHKEFQKNNPIFPFSDFLACQGIEIRPPSISKKIKQAEHRSYNKCSVFSYVPCGGRVFRYDFTCENGLITDVDCFLLGYDIGDCWYIM